MFANSSRVDSYVARGNLFFFFNCQQVSFKVHDFIRKEDLKCSFIFWFFSEKNKKIKNCTFKKKCIKTPLKNSFNLTKNRKQANINIDMLKKICLLNKHT